MEKKRLYNIDLLKGILILLVIAGHIILGSINKQILRYIIYSFHMPVFIAVSGFLINRKVLEDISLTGLVKKYFPRLLIPWGIAVLVYNIILNHSKLSEMMIKGLVIMYLKWILKPYYHLWFILGFISYILLVWILLKLRLKNWMILMTSILIGVISKWELFNINNNIISNFVSTLHYDFRIYNFFFFVLGMLLKEYVRKNDIPMKSLKVYPIIIIIMVMLSVYFFYYDNSLGKKLIYYFLNIPLVIWLLSISYKEFLPRCCIIEFIGQNSMAFYLWHVIAKLAAQALTKGKSDLKYYTYSVIFLILIYILIYLLSKISFINKYLFGAQRKAVS